MVPCERKSQLSQHVATSTHKDAMKKLDGSGKRQKMVDDIFGNTDNTNERQQFFTDVCELFVAVAYLYGSWNSNPFKLL